MTGKDQWASSYTVALKIVVLKVVILRREAGGCKIKHSKTGDGLWGRNNKILVPKFLIALFKLLTALKWKLLYLSY